MLLRHVPKPLCSPGILRAKQPKCKVAVPSSSSQPRVSARASAILYLTPNPITVSHAAPPHPLTALEPAVTGKQPPNTQQHKNMPLCVCVCVCECVCVCLRVCLHPVPSHFKLKKKKFPTKSAAVTVPNIFCLFSSSPCTTRREEAHNCIFVAF